MWQEALSIFLQNYEPCSNLANSTHQYSTLEITTMLRNLVGTQIDAAEVSETLKSRGFHYVQTGDVSMDWLMHQVSLPGQ